MAGVNNMENVGISSILGTRKSQQDSVFGQFDDKMGIAILCDGMGGLRGGALASQTAVKTLAADYFAEKDIRNVPVFFRNEARKADREVCSLCDEKGVPLGAGTTLVSVLIKDGELFWLSVGDSKIYIIRKNEIFCVNRLHNYRMVMDRLLANGQITLKEYQDREKQAETLISFIGMGDVSLMDTNSKGFRLQAQDIVLLASDGLYRLLPDEDILEIVRKNMSDMPGAARALTDEASGRVVHTQDNTSVVLVRYPE